MKCRQALLKLLKRLLKMEQNLKMFQHVITFIQTSEELTARYNVPVLGTIPEFEIDNKKAKKKNNKEENK